DWWSRRSDPRSVNRFDSDPVRVWAPSLATPSRGTVSVCSRIIVSNGFFTLSTVWMCARTRTLRGRALLKVEKELLTGVTASVSDQPSILPDHAVARHDHAQRIQSDSFADRLRQ